MLIRRHSYSSDSVYSMTMTSAKVLDNTLSWCLKFILWFSLYIGMSSSAFADLVKVPELNSRVTDLTSSLAAENVAKIEASLASLEQAKGAQVAVLIVQTTSPEAIEDYSLRVFEQWKLGRKEIDDGVLLLIALKDRKMRIEVGYGLEGAITDLSAGRIIKEYIAPEFRKGNITEGVNAGLTQITNLINGEPLPEASTKQGDFETDWFEKFMFFIVASMFLAPKLKSILGFVLSIAVIAVVSFGLVWFLSNNLWVASIATFFLSSFHAITGSSSSSYNDGGGYGGGFGGGSSGGSSGGGFSGGGGGFGGGGASGGW